MYENSTLIGSAEIRIIQLFLDLDKHYFAEIARKTKITRPRVLRALRALVKQGVLEISAEANVKYYILKRGVVSYNVLSIVEYNKTSRFLEKNKILKRALEMLMKDYDSCLILLIFGSFTKGYATKNSDVDLLIVKEGFSKEDIRRVEDLAGMIKGRTGIAISPYLMKLDELRNKNKVAKEAIENHIILIGGELFFRTILQ